jgi:hypothetical protein
VTKDKALEMALEALIWTTGSGDFGEGGQAYEGAKNCLFPAITAIEEALAQPVQEPQYEYLIDDLAEWKQYVEVDTAPYGLREHVTKVLLAHGIKEKNT